ncbi:hypothetical protein PG995_002991 [Apiospora arundinis]
MHLKDLRNNSLTKRLRGGSRASTDDDVKDPLSKATASAPTEQASVKQPPTQKDTEDGCRRNLNRRQYYTRVFDDLNTKILEDFNDRLIVSAGYRSNPQYITNVIRQCCNTVSSCLLEEWLLRQSCSSSTSSSSSIRSDAYEHIEVSRQRLCIFLADIDYTADQDMESASMAQLVSGELIGITISAITVVALDAGKALGSERATMTLSHSLLASAHIAAQKLTNFFKEKSRNGFQISREIRSTPGQNLESVMVARVADSLQNLMDCQRKMWPKFEDMDADFLEIYPCYQEEEGGPIVCKTVADHD